MLSPFLHRAARSGYLFEPDEVLYARSVIG